jgi:ankyrin repeat protein
LISKGSTLGLKDADGRSPLHLAVEQGHVEIVKILHRQGSPLNSTDLLGRTPLHCAEVFGQKSIAQYLEGWGADLDMIDEAGMSVRDWRNKLLK